MAAVTVPIRRRHTQVIDINLTNTSSRRPSFLSLHTRVTMASLKDQILDEMTAVNLAVAIAVAVLVIPLAVWSYDKYRFRKLPPGPPTRPFIGNKHLIPASRPWLKMAEWSEIYVWSINVVNLMIRDLSTLCGRDVHPPLLFPIPRSLKI